MGWANKATLGMAAVLAAAILAYNYRDMENMSDLTQQIYLKMYGDSIYEYHKLTGKWPEKIDDLAKTSLPRINSHWKSQLDIQADVIVWPVNLKSNPQENSNVILAYHNKGLDAENGKMWVCWGDLRTGWIPLEELQEIFNQRKKGEKAVDANLVGVWQNRNDSREIWTIRADGTLKWFYQGVPALGIPDSIVAYTYRADPAQSPAHFDMIHPGVLGTSYFIYKVTGDELRIGISQDKGPVKIRPKSFAEKDRFYQRRPEPKN